METPAQALLGIVIPSYNQAPYLERALQSAIACKACGDVKICVMDGGSTDGSVEIIARYAPHLSRWQSCADGGQAAAINRGIRQLSGCRYIAWLNSDDVYEFPQELLRMAAYAERQNAALCYARSHYLSEAGVVIGEYPVCTRANAARLYHRCSLSQPSVIFKRAVWAELGGLDERYFMCLDYDFWVRIALNYPLLYYNHFVGATRLYPNTKTAQFQQKNEAECICLLYRNYGLVRGRLIRRQMRTVLDAKLQGFGLAKKLACCALWLLAGKRLTRHYALLSEGALPTEGTLEKEMQPL